MIQCIRFYLNKSGVEIIFFTTMTEIRMQAITQDALNLDKENRILVAKIIYRYNPDLVYIKADGCRTILNKLPEEVINEIYNFIQYKLKL